MKNYLIIGASSGIGKQLAETLATAGHKVYGTFRNTIVSESHSNVDYHELDVTQAELNLDFLPDELHGIAYCPGSINLKPFKRLKPAAFVSDFELQVVGAIKIIQQVLPKLKAAGNASIVTFSTVAVQTGFNFHTQVATSKGAIEGLSRSLAAELAPSIRVNCIAPSLTDTPLASKLLSTDEKREANAQRHPLKKVGTPADIANMAAFLMSDQSAWMTGQVLAVDGGMSSVRG
ncbi:MAG: SDR family NAD(P)-dependent oxidoreductase [Saprospiraceae bacterium]